MCANEGMSQYTEAAFLIASTAPASIYDCTMVFNVSPTSEGNAFLLRMPLTTAANFTNDPIVVFGLFNLSSEVDNLYMFELIRGIHEFATNAIIALITIHILAAIYHHFIVKDDTTKNMLKFWTRKSVR